MNGLKRTGRREWRLLFVLLALAAVRGMLYAVIIPPWQAPDEPQHYQMVRLTMDLRRVPTYVDAWSASRLHTEVFESLVKNDFWEYRHHLPAPRLKGSYVAANILNQEKMFAAVSHPPLYYVLAAVLLWPFNSTSVVTQLYVLRFVSVLIGLVTIGSIYLAASNLAQEKRARVWAAVCFVAFLPMHSFSMGSLNNDILAVMLSALVFVMLISACYRGLSIVRGLAVGLLMLFALLTKRTSLFLLPVALLAWTWCSWRAGPGSRARIFGSGAGGRTGRRAVALAGFFLLLVAGVLVGDALIWHWWGITDRLLNILHYSWRPWETSFSQYAGFVLLGFASFWANFGWMNVPLDVAWYVALAGLSIVAALGGVKGAWRVLRDRNVDTSRRCAWCVCLAALVLIGLQVLASVFLRQMPFQGRYLFPALVPIALCFVWGLFEWVPRHHQHKLLILLVVWWVLFDSIAVLGYILPYYYG